MLAIIISVLAVMLTSLVGVLFTHKIFGGIFERNLSLLVSFSAGVFLIVLANLSLEVFAYSETWLTPFLWILAGALMVTLFFKFLSGFHHHHDESHTHDKHSKIDARRIVFSDSIHNIGDGILLAASFAVSIPVGIAAAVSIVIHELVQEISEFFVLKQAGLSTKKALLVNFVSSSALLIGALGAFFLLETFEKLEIPLLAFSAGAFLIVVLVDLIPESVRQSNKKSSWGKHLLAFVLGIVLMVGFGALVPHAEHDGHGQDGHEDEEHLEDEHD